MPFREVAGHRRLLLLLARSIRDDTLPPSLIFAGSPESGTRAAALAAAQALNCLTPVIAPADDAAGGGAARFPFDACGSCAACLKIARGVHADLLVVEPGENGSIRIDQIREVIDRAAYRPFEGRRRVVIIDEADALMAPAQNALLKTLEEPTPSSVFILVTGRPDMLLDTVRSRCPLLRFPSIAADETDDAAVEIAARVLRQVAAAPPTARLAAAKDLLTGTGAGGARDREQLAAYLHAMSSLLRETAAWSASEGSAPAGSDTRRHVERLAGDYAGERGVRAFATVDRGLEALDRNAAVKIVADWVVLNL